MSYCRLFVGSHSLSHCVRNHVPSKQGLKATTPHRPPPLSFSITNVTAHTNAPATLSRSVRLLLKSAMVNVIWHLSIRMCWGPEGTHSPDCPCPGTLFQPLGAISPCPSNTAAGPVSSSHSPALPVHGSHQARPTCGLTSRPGLSLSPGRCLMPRAGAALVPSSCLA